MDNQSGDAPAGEYRVVLVGTGSDVQSGSGDGGMTPETQTHTRISYYYFGSQRVALRRGGVVNWLHADHLGNVSETTSATGGRIATQRYYPYGRVRWGSAPTSYNFTGQRLDPSTGRLFFQARYYDPRLARFAQADTIVPEPGDPQSLNRYAYVLNNPLRYTDPTGHRKECSITSEGCGDPNYWRDLTYWFVEAANYYAAIPEVEFMELLNELNEAHTLPGNRVLAYGMFYELVQDSGPWDFKDQMQRQIGSTVGLGNRWFEFSAPGNIFYGFIGARAGIPLADLHIGASVAQIRDHLVEGGPLGERETLFDTADDYYAIEFGYRLYQQKYAPDKEVTVQEFNALLTSYTNLNKMQPGSAPAPKQAPDSALNWPYPPDYFNGPKQPWPPFLFPSFR